MKVDTNQALAAQAMEVFTSLLGHATWEIRGKAARDIMDIRWVHSFMIDWGVPTEFGAVEFMTII